MKQLLYSVLIMLCLFSGVAGQSPNGTISPQPDRLLIIGDSLTAGLYATSENTTFARLVADSTGAKLARRYVSTLDGAISEWSRVQVWRPGIVVIEVGLNDVSKGQYDGLWKARYQSLVQTIQGSGASVIVATIFWGGIHKEHPRYNIYLELNESIREVARNTDAPLADLWMATLDCEDCVSAEGDESYWSPGYRGDNFHPNDRGHARIAQTIIEAIRRCVCDPNAPEPTRHIDYFPVMIGG